MYTSGTYVGRVRLMTAYFITNQKGFSVCDISLCYFRWLIEFNMVDRQIGGDRSNHLTDTKSIHVQHLSLFDL